MQSKCNFCPNVFDKAANSVCDRCGAEKHIGASQEGMVFGAALGAVAGLAAAFYLFGPLLIAGMLQFQLVQNYVIGVAIGGFVGFVGTMFLFRNHVVWKRVQTTKH